MDFNSLISKLERAYHDERNAAAFYSQLLAQAPDYDSTDALVEARHDEREHAYEIAELYEELTGQDPVELPPVIPQYTTFREGLTKALQGEREAIDFYQEIINTSTIEAVKELFREIREDEIVHFVKFQALLRFKSY